MKLAEVIDKEVAGATPADPDDETALPAGLAPGASKLVGEGFFYLLVTHFAVDCFSSTLPTVQPILAERFDLSLAGAGLLGGFWMFASSVLQLPFGLVSDRLQSRHFTILSPLATAAFLSAMGLASDYGMLLALLLLGGLGSASYHPYSTSQAGRLGAGRRAFATAVFITVGTAGLGFGPLYITGVIDLWSFEQLWIAAVPVALLVPVLLWRMPGAEPFARRSRTAVDWHALAAHRGPLLTLYALVVLRSIVQVGLAQFVSLYMVQVRGASFEAASVALAVYFMSTSVGSFVGGAAADRYGGRAVIVASSVACVPLLALFVGTDGLLSLFALFVGGVALLSTVPVNVAMAQELVPSQAGTVSALMMGFGWGTAGIVFVPLAGWLADLAGLDVVFWGFAILPLVAAPLALRLPRPGAKS